MFQPPHLGGTRCIVLAKGMKTLALPGPVVKNSVVFPLSLPSLFAGGKERIQGKELDTPGHTERQMEGAWVPKCVCGAVLSANQPLDYV